MFYLRTSESASPEHVAWDADGLPKFPGDSYIH